MVGGEKRLNNNFIFYLKLVFVKDLDQINENELSEALQTKETNSQGSGLDTER